MFYSPFSVLHPLYLFVFLLSFPPSLCPYLSLSFYFSLSLSLSQFVSRCSHVAWGVWCNESENQYPSTGKYRPRLATARAPPRKSRSLFRERTERSPFPPDAVATSGPPQDRLNLAPPISARLPPLCLPPFSSSTSASYDHFDFFPPGVFLVICFLLFLVNDIILLPRAASVNDSFSHFRSSF